MRPKALTGKDEGELLFKWLLKMTFGEEFTLDYFPFDMQPLQMVFSSPIPTSNLIFVPAGSDEEESLIQRTNFRLNKVFFLFRKVDVKTYKTSKAESSHGKQRPVIKITATIRRKVRQCAHVNMNGSSSHERQVRLFLLTRFDAYGLVACFLVQHLTPLQRASSSNGMLNCPWLV